MIAQNLGFTPPSGKEIAMYVVILRALADASTAFTAFPNESTPMANYWNGQDDFSGYRWAHSSQPATLANSVFLSSDPKGADNTRSYSTSSSISIGANAGFFGGVLTGGKLFSHPSRVRWRGCNRCRSELDNVSFPVGNTDAGEDCGWVHERYFADCLYSAAAEVERLSASVAGPSPDWRWWHG